MTVFIIDYTGNDFLDESMYRFDSEKSEKCPPQLPRAQGDIFKFFCLTYNSKPKDIQYPVIDTKKSFLL